VSRGTPGPVLAGVAGDDSTVKEVPGA
jgi:hypothetical protein